MSAGGAPRFALVLASCLLAAEVAAASYAARVVAVHDGDTLTVLAQRREVRLRLAAIDAPERGQPYAQASRRALAARVAGRVVDIEARGRDRYGRTLAVVRVDGVDVNRAQVRDGWAWVFRRVADEPGLLALEDEARRERRGLWRDAHPVPPWTWRDRPAAARPRDAAAPPATPVPVPGR